MSESIQTSKDKSILHEGWNDSMQEWIDSSELRMKNDTIQLLDEWIQCKSECFVRQFRLKWVDSSVIRFKKLWIDSSIVRELDESILWVMGRFSSDKNNNDTFSEVNPRLRHIDAGCFLSRQFLSIKAIWLAFDSLFYFTTEHLILREKGKKRSNYPFEKNLGSGVSYIKGRC